MPKEDEAPKPKPKPKRKPPRKKRKSEYQLRAPEATEQSVYDDVRTLCDLNLVARKYDMTPKQLRKKFSRAIRIGQADGAVKVAAVLHQKATAEDKPNLRTATFLAQSRMGYTRPSTAPAGRMTEDGSWQPFTVQVAKGESKPVLVVPQPLDPDTWNKLAAAHLQRMQELYRNVHGHPSPVGNPPEEPSEPPQPPKPATVTRLRMPGPEDDLVEYPPVSGRKRLRSTIPS